MLAIFEGSANRPVKKGAGASFHVCNPMAGFLGHDFKTLHPLLDLNEFSQAGIDEETAMLGVEKDGLMGTGLDEGKVLAEGKVFKPTLGGPHGELETLSVGPVLNHLDVGGEVKPELLRKSLQRDFAELLVGRRATKFGVLGVPRAAERAVLEKVRDGDFENLAGLEEECHEAVRLGDSSLLVLLGEKGAQVLDGISLVKDQITARLHGEHY